MVIAGANSYQGDPFGELLSASHFSSSEKLGAESQQVLEKEAKKLGRNVRVHSVVCVREVDSPEAVNVNVHCTVTNQSF